MRTEKEIIGSAVVLTVLEPRIDGPRGVELKQILAQIIDEGHCAIVVDLGAVGFIDSTGLCAIVSSLKLLGRTGELALCGLAEAVRALLKLTRMDKVFRLFPARQDAVAALTGRA